VDITGDGGKCQRRASPAGAPVTSGAMLEITCQPSGAVTVNSKLAFRSGWSKQAYTRWASNVSRSV
jgi:hypothetical protein